LFKLTYAIFQISCRINSGIQLTCMLEKINLNNKIGLKVIGLDYLYGSSRSYKRLNLKP